MIEWIKEDGQRKYSYTPNKKNRKRLKTQKIKKIQKTCKIEERIRHKKPNKIRNAAGAVGPQRIYLLKLSCQG